MLLVKNSEISCNIRYDIVLSSGWVCFWLDSLSIQYQHYGPCVAMRKWAGIHTLNYELKTKSNTILKLPTYFITDTFDYFD